MSLIAESFFTAVNSIFFIVSSYIPKLVAGILILLIGLVVASLLKDLINLIFKYFKVEKWIQATGLAREKDLNIWPTILSELVRWTTIFVFLMSSVEVWGVPKVGDVLNQLLIFLPNVFVAVVIGWIGIVVAQFSFNIVRHGVGGLGGNEALFLGNIARYSVLFFTALIILTELGVAAELIKILFTGIVATFALAFGLAFGFGGKDEAREILKSLRKRLDVTEKKPKS